MSAAGWRGWIRRWFFHPSPRVRPRRLWLEPLEDRTVPSAIYKVTLLGDTGAQDSSDESGMSGDLAYCISRVNNDQGDSSLYPDTIQFAINGGGSAQTISLTQALPALTNPVVIDGSTQGALGSHLITIDGGGMPIDGFDLTTGAGGSTIQDLVIENCSVGIGVDFAAGVTIRGNFIGNNSGAGVSLFDSPNDFIQGNTIGVTSAGDKAANGVGVLIFGSSHGSPISNGNFIGGPNPGDGNVIDGNTGDGVQLLGPGVLGTTVEGNFIGVNAAGDQELGNGGNGVSLLGETKGGPQDSVIGAAGAPNVISGNGGAGVLLDGGTVAGTVVQGNAIHNNSGYGVVIQRGASNNTIGGTTAAEQNVISDNSGGGVEITDSGTNYNTIEGNSITDNVAGSGSFPSQGEGVAIVNSAGFNVVGGTQSGQGNVISGNAGDGVLIDDGFANYIEGNFIGTDATGMNPRGNVGDGVRIQNGASRNNVGMFSGEGPSGAPNVIAFNAKGVVVVGDSTSNQISENSIFGNAGPGIDLGDDGPTPNGTAGPGPNDFLNHPVITFFTSEGEGAEVKGLLNAAPSTLNQPAQYQIEVFASPADGGPFQGKYFLGSFQVTTDATGLATFDKTVYAPPSGWVVDATATDVGDDTTYGDTSEFSSGPPVNFVVSAPSNIDEQDPFAVTVRAVDAYGETAGGFRGTVTLSTNDPRTSLPASYTFTAEDAGVHTFGGVRLLTPGAETLAVNGGGLTGSAVVHVGDTAPTVFLDPVLPAAAMTAIRSQGRFTDPDGANWTATVDYGDNTGLQPLALAADKSFQLQHVYAHEGSYSITVVVTDESGVSSPPIKTLAEVFIAGTDPGKVGVGKAGHGQTITVAAPGVTAMLTHNGPGDAYLLVTPVPPLGNAAFTLLTAGPGGTTRAVSYDVRGVNLSNQDRLVVRFSYPENDPAPQLFYFDSSAGIFRAVPSIVNTADHTVTVVLTGGTKPSVADLNGTVFTITTSPINFAALQNTGPTGPIYISNQSGAVVGGSLGGALASAVSLFGVGTVAISDGGGGGGDDSSNASPQTAVQEILNDLPTSTTTNADAGTPPGTAVLSPSQATLPDGAPDTAAPDDGKKPLPPPPGPGALRLWLTAPPAEGFDADGTRPAASMVATAAFGAVQRWVMGATLAGVLPFAVMGLQSRKGVKGRDLEASGGRKPPDLESCRRPHQESGG